jgi:inosine-uridine nucleoside N-ribohydrolase
MTRPEFPVLERKAMESRLTPPEGPVRLLIDTDAANEIDDQYAIAWALLSPEHMIVEAVTAEPFSFAHHQRALLAMEQEMDLEKFGEKSSLAPSQDWLDQTHEQRNWVERLHAQGRRATDVKFVKPAEGMELSYQEILRVYDKLGIDPGDKVYRGSEQYLSAPDVPLKTEAAEVIIDLAKSGDSPLYIAAMGCVTNIASALLMAPEIVNDIVVIWTSAYPSKSPHCNKASLNLVQDVHASRLLFDCGVPHIYLPGYHVGAQLKISLPEMERCVRGQGAIGDYLYHLYTHNPLHEMFAIEDAERRTWVIWDIIDIAWLINPDWVPSYLTTSPVLDEKLFWQNNDARHLMREGYDVQRDEIYLDFYRKLEAANR